MRGEILWFRLPVRGDSAERLTGKLDGLGVHLANPFTGAVTLLTDEGRTEVTAQAAREGLGGSRPLNVKLWLDEDADVVLTVRSSSGVDVLEFDLDGLDRDEADRVASAVLWCAVTDPESLGLVLDSRLPDTACSWEAHFVTGAAPPSWTPELLWSRVDEARSSLDVPAHSWPVS
ncbi:hypothetical protein [Streptosporangium carneum]|uniref:Uncharacterized protein n=1 Tax=Streptosporangium carneum TaxID=47481 RepID=A0A9W6MDU3_9ACTN|nr:hypothetical protein [Streptosporangium carneum]GLK10285.1 hypothetical protein GCM10017600_36910 [Streptosporangium carneum]